MSNAIRPHTLEVGSTMVYCNDLRYDLYMKPRNTTYRRDGTKRSPPPISYVVLYIYTHDAINYKVWYIYTYAILSGFSYSCSVDTSRNNTSWYSYLYDTYCCGTTGTCTSMNNTQNNTGRKWHGFSVDIRVNLFLCGGRKRLGFESESKLTRFLCRGHRNWLVLEWGSKWT